MDYNKRLFHKEIQRKALLQLFNGLNDKISEMEETWRDEDYEFLSELDRGQVEWYIEPILNENFYPGSIPSLIESPIEKLPNIAAFCYQGVPRNSEDDFGDFIDYNLVIEIMARSNTSEEEVNVRTDNLMEAANMGLLDDKTLGGIVTSIGPAKTSKGDVFIRRERQGQGNTWYMQGGSLEYVVEKYINFV